MPPQGSPTNADYKLFGDRAQMGEDPNEKEEVKLELSKSRKQMEESRQRLTKLRNDAWFWTGD